METELFNALARVLLQDTVDVYGNKQFSPLKKAIEDWAINNGEDIAALVVKNIGKEELAEKAANKVVAQLISNNSWSTNHDKESLKKEVLTKLADKLANIELEKLTKNP